MLNHCFNVSEVDCGEPSRPKNGRVEITGTEFNDIANFQCDEGYDLLGSKSRVCQADGSWSGEETVCERKYRSNEMKTIQQNPNNSNKNEVISTGPLY